MDKSWRLTAPHPKTREAICSLRVAGVSVYSSWLAVCLQPRVLDSRLSAMPLSAVSSTAWHSIVALVTHTAQAAAAPASCNPWVAMPLQTRRAAVSILTCCLVSKAWTCRAMAVLVSFRCSSVTVSCLRACTHLPCFLATSAMVVALLLYNFLLHVCYTCFSRWMFGC